MLHRYKDERLLVDLKVLMMQLIKQNILNNMAKTFAKVNFTVLFLSSYITFENVFFDFFYLRPFTLTLDQSLDLSPQCLSPSMLAWTHSIWRPMLIHLSINFHACTLNGLNGEFYKYIKLWPLTRIEIEKAIMVRLIVTVQMFRHKY